MKVLYLVFWVAFLSLAASADAYSESDKSKETCRLANFIPKGTVTIPEIDGGDEDSPPVPQDPLHIPNTTVVLKEEVLSGTYSLGNGLVTGLSTLEHDLKYSPLYQRLNLNVTLKHVRLTGDYEIIDGKANVTDLGGEHTFHGSGPLNASAAGVKATTGFLLKFNMTTQQVSIDRLKLNFTFDSAHIVAENLVVDGKPVNWQLINALMKPMFDALWPEAQNLIVQQIQDQVNWLLEGCTLKDLIDIFTPKPPPPQQ